MIPDESTRLLQVEVLDDITDEVNTVSVKVVLVLCKAQYPRLARPKSCRQISVGIRSSLKKPKFPSTTVFCHSFYIDRPYNYVRVLKGSGIPS